MKVNMEKTKLMVNSRETESKQVNGPVVNAVKELK